MKIMKCKKCGFELSENDKVCPICNEPVEQKIVEEPKKETIVCPFCHETIGKDETSCPYCGKELNSAPKPTSFTPNTQNFCQYCGHKLEPNANFCEHCGHILKTPEPTIDTTPVIKARLDFPQERKLSLIGVLVYFGIFYLVAPLLSQLVVIIVIAASGINLGDYNNDINQILANYPELYVNIIATVNLFTYLLLFASVFVIMFKLLKYDIIALRGRMSEFWKNFGITFAILFVASYASSLLVQLLLFITGLNDFQDNSQNQMTINMMLTANGYTAIVTIIMTIIAAPIIEELVFRKGFFGISKQKGIGTVVASGLIFGGIHIIDGVISGIIGVINGTGAAETIVVELIYFINYAGAGLALSFAYRHNKFNIVPNIAAHLAYNAFGIIISLLASLLA